MALNPYGFSAAMVLSGALFALFVWGFNTPVDMRFTGWIILQGVLLYLAGDFPEYFGLLLDICRDIFVAPRGLLHDLSTRLQILLVCLVTSVNTSLITLELIKRISPHLIDNIWVLTNWARVGLLSTFCLDLALVLALHRIFDHTRERELKHGGHESSSRYYVASRDGSFYARLSRRATGEWRPPGRAFMKIILLCFALMLVSLVTSSGFESWPLRFWIFSGLLMVSLPVFAILDSPKR